MSCKISLEEICSMVESSVFDRKSAKIDAKSLAVHLIAFANADGGTLAIGVEDDGKITGIDGYAENINELLRVPFDFCKPSVQVETERIPCKNAKGLSDHILLIEVLQSNDIHTNQADEVFFRIGDKSKKLNFDERLQLMYSKGTRYFEDAPVPDATMDDIDLDFVREYTAKLGYRKSAQEYLLENKEFIKEKNGGQEVSAAAVLLFGKNPKHFFPRARIRFIRYEGTEARVGAAMNVIKDVSFEGRILQVTEKALEFVRSQIKERTYLGADARFVTESEYPEFAWKELIVNAVAHRLCKALHKRCYAKLIVMQSYCRIHWFYRKYRKGLYSVMLLNGTLPAHLVEIDEAAQKRIECIVGHYAEQEGITEELKAHDPMEWVRRMNGIKAQSEEIVLSELVYE